MSDGSLDAPAAQPLIFLVRSDELSTGLRSGCDPRCGPRHDRLHRQNTTPSVRSHRGSACCSTVVLRSKMPGG